MPDKITQDIYNARADDYGQLTLEVAEKTRLRAFIASLPAGGTVLDLGCGPGWAAAAMRDAGMRVTAMDASPEMARVGKELYDIDITVAPFSTLTAQQAFDGIWAHFSLLHAPRAEFPGHMAALHRALKPGGKLLLGMKLGEGESRDKLQRFYSYYSADELHALLADAGFTLTHAETKTVPGFDGTPSPSIILSAHA